jgi:hypothetical protein
MIVLALIVVMAAGSIVDPPLGKRSFASPLKAYQVRLPTPAQFEPLDDPDSFLFAFVAMVENTRRRQVVWSSLESNCIESTGLPSRTCAVNDDLFSSSVDQPPYMASATEIDDSSRTIEQRATLQFPGPSPTTLRQSVFTEPASSNIFATPVTDAANRPYTIFDSNVASTSFAFSLTPGGAVANNTAVTCVLVPFTKLGVVVRGIQRMLNKRDDDFGLLCAEVRPQGTFVAPRDGLSYVRLVALSTPLASGFDADLDVDWSTRQPLLHTVAYRDCSLSEFFKGGVKASALLQVPVKCSPAWRRTANATKDWPCDTPESNVRWMPLIVNVDFSQPFNPLDASFLNFAGGLDPDAHTVVPFVAVQRQGLKPSARCTSDFETIAVVQGPSVGTLSSKYGLIKDNDFGSQGSQGVNLNAFVKLRFDCDDCTADEWLVGTGAPTSPTSNARSLSIVCGAALIALAAASFD